MKKWMPLFFRSLMLFPQTGYAQEQKIQTDQPDQSNGASVVDKKMLQVESSVYFNSFKGNSNAVVSSTVLRYGIAEKVEIRLLAEQGYHRDLYISETAHATSPLAIGTKVEVAGEKRFRPAISLMAWLQLPITNFKDQPRIWSPAFVIIAEKRIGDFTVTLNAGPKQEAFEPVWEWQSTGEVKYEVGAKMAVFGEYFGQYEAHENPLHNLDGGILYAITNRIQVHLAAGSSIFYQPSNYFVNTGVAFNFTP